MSTTNVESTAWGLARRAYAVVGNNAVARAAQRAAISVLGKAGVVGRARLGDGDVLYVDIANRVGSSIWLRGTWDAELVAWVTGELGPGDAFVDVGANVGYYSAIASRRVGKEGLVVAVEASPPTAALLARSIIANQWGNVVLCPLVAGSSTSTATFVLETDSGLSRAGLASPLRLVSARLDDIVLPLLEKRRVRGMKLDIEGGELQALRGLERLFALNKPPRVLLEANVELVGVAGVHALYEWFATHGMKPVDPVTAGPLPEAQLLAEHQLNVGFVPVDRA